MNDCIFQEIEADCKWLLYQSGMTFFGRTHSSLQNMVTIACLMTQGFNKKKFHDFTYQFRDIEFLLYTDHLDIVNHTKNIIVNLDKVIKLNND